MLWVCLCAVNRQEIKLPQQGNSMCWREAEAIDHREEERARSLSRYLKDNLKKGWVLGYSTGQRCSSSLGMALYRARYSFTAPDIMARSNRAEKRSAICTISLGASLCTINRETSDQIGSSAALIHGN